MSDHPGLSSARTLLGQLSWNPFISIHGPSTLPLGWKLPLFLIFRVEPSVSLLQQDPPGVVPTPITMVLNKVCLTVFLTSVTNE